MFDSLVRQQIEDFLLEKVSNDFSIWRCYNWCCDAYDSCGEEDYSDVVFLCRANRYENGVTKIVLFYDDLPNWVIKIPILGNYIEEIDEYRDFSCSGTGSGNDYCLTEKEYTFDAINYGLENCFINTYYVCEINGVKFYCSPKIDKVYHDVFHYGDKKIYSKPDSFDQAKNLEYCCENECYLDIEDLAFFIDAYGEAVAEKLIRFLYDWDIHDLHHGNLGFDKQGNIKIIDCSGWRD